MAVKATVFVGMSLDGFIALHPARDDAGGRQRERSAVLLGIPVVRGLILPLKSTFKGEPRRLPIFGVLTGPKSVIGQLFALLFLRPQTRDYYPVDPDGAIEVLRTRDADAADWWEKNAPHVLGPTRILAFEVEVCELISH